MKKTQLLLIFIASVFSITSCNNFGDKVNVEGTKGEVYFKDGASQADARKLGDFLKSDGFFSDQRAASVQITKDGDNYLVRFVYNKDYYEKHPELDDFFKNYGARMSQELFEEKKVDIMLTDKYFKTFKNFPFNKSAAESTEHGETNTYSDYHHETVGDVSFYWKGISDDESNVIKDYIVKNGSFAGGTSQIYITKEGDDHYTLKFPVKEGYRNDISYITKVEGIAKQIKDNVFAKTPYSFQITDENLNAVKTFDY
jgi:hypothetical protein